MLTNKVQQTLKKFLNVLCAVITPYYHKIYRLYTRVVSKIAITSVKLRISSFIGRLNIHSALAVAGMLGPMLVTIGDLTASVSNPDYSLVKNSISSLALLPIGWLQTIGFLALGLLVEIFTAGLLFNIKRARGFHLGIIVLIFFGFGMLLIGAFNTDPVGAARTMEGRIHGFAATTAFSLFPLALLFLASSIRKDPDWKNLFRYSEVTFILAVLFGITLKIVQEKSGWFGLVERLLVANMVIWVEVAAIKLFLLSLNRDMKRQE
jgi:hypothetical protein